MKISGVKKERVKTTLFEVQDGLCAYCGRPIVLSTSTIDHVIPQSKGGTWAKANLVLSHKYCNRLKGSVILPDSLLNNKQQLYKIFRTRNLNKIKDYDESYVSGKERTTQAG